MLGKLSGFVQQAEVMQMSLQRIESEPVVVPGTKLHSGISLNICIKGHSSLRNALAVQSCEDIRETEKTNFLFNGQAPTFLETVP